MRLSQNRNLFYDICPFSFMLTFVIWSIIRKNTMTFNGEWLKTLEIFVHKSIFPSILLFYAFIHADLAEISYLLYLKKQLCGISDFPGLPQTRFSHSTGHFCNDILCSSYKEMYLLHSTCICAESAYSWSVLCNFQGLLIKGSTIHLPSWPSLES